MAETKNKGAKAPFVCPVCGSHIYKTLSTKEYERLLNELDNKKRREAEKAIQQQA